MKIGLYSRDELLAQYTLKRCSHNLIISCLSFLLLSVYFFICVGTTTCDISSELDLVSEELLVLTFLLGFILFAFVDFLADFYKFIVVVKRDLSSVED